MWILVRADAQLPESQRHGFLAACPDGHTDLPRLWGVGLAGRGIDAEVLVTVDDARVTHTVADLRGEPGRVARAAGTQLVVLGLHGTTTVEDATATYRRTLVEGDILVIEGPDPETLTLTPATGARASVVTFTSTQGTTIRWIP